MIDEYLRGVRDALAAIHALGGIYVLEAIEKLGLQEQNFEDSAFLRELQQRRDLEREKRDGFEAGLPDDYEIRRMT